MRDVATYSRWRIALGALPSFLFAAIGLGAGLILGPIMMLAEIRRLHEGYSPLIVCVFPTAIGVLFLVIGIRRVREALEKNCWLRAGPEGLAWRLPGRGHWKTLWCVYPVDEYFVAWKDVEGFTLWKHSINGIPTGSDLVLIAKKGWRKTFERAYFRESADVIHAGIKDAAAGR
jgi:hypothetical protein